MATLPPLNALKAFDAASRCLNFTKAAIELHVTHGAVSRQISALEEHYQFPLFVRAGRGLSLTSAGIELARVVNATFANLRLVNDQMLEAIQPDVSLRVSVPPTLAMWWLMPRMAALEKDGAANSHIELSTSIAPVDFGSHSYDAAIRRITSVPRGMSAQSFLDGRAIPVCSPEFRERNKLYAVSDLSRAALVKTRSEEYAWDRWLTSHKIKRRSGAPVMVFDQLYFALEAAIDSLGVALAPIALVQNEIRRKRLCALASVESTGPVSYALLSPRSSAKRESIVNFGSWLKAVATVRT